MPSLDSGVSVSEPSVDVVGLPSVAESLLSTIPPEPEHAPKALEIKSATTPRLVAPIEAPFATNVITASYAWP
jgi:hypothetical protein